MILNLICNFACSHKATVKEQLYPFLLLFLSAQYQEPGRDLRSAHHTRLQSHQTQLLTIPPSVIANIKHIMFCREFSSTVSIMNFARISGQM
jgi:hypothetical protein